MGGLKKLLLVRPDRAGDAIKTLPALRAVKERLAHWEIHLLTTEFNDSLFSFETGVRVASLPSHWDQLSDVELKRSISERAGTDFDIAVTLPCDATPEVKKIVPLLPSKRIYSVLAGTEFQLRFASGTPAGSDERENIAFLIGTSLGIPLQAQGFSAAPVLSAMDRQEAKEQMGLKRGKWYALCPSASMAKRSLKPETVISLINHLTAKKTVEKVILPGGPSDFEKLENLKKATARPEKVQAVFPACFRTLGAYLERCDGLLGVDSGPLHLAIAIGLPALGFLGGCDKDRWYPMKDPRFTFFHRGLLGRFPTGWGGRRIVDRWLAAAPDAELSPTPWQTPIPVLF